MPLSMPTDSNWRPYGALYLHVPFCVSKCAYCDFESKAVCAGDERMDAYVDDMVHQIRQASKQGILGSIRTVYLGGGTPSHLGLARLSQILYTLSLSMHLTPEVECTMEANPESLSERMVYDLWALGVNRLSIGVQSFDDDVLRLLGRPHSSADAERVIKMAQSRFDNISIDLMCGIPGQTLETFEHSVKRAVELGVSHVSVYPLTIEEGTPFDRMVLAGELAEPSDDFAAQCMDAASHILEAAGYTRYEVASYALPGCESRHNTAYWTGVPYLGLGPSAVSMREDELVRQRVQDGAVIEEIDAFEALIEDLMLGMRMVRGIACEDVEAVDLICGDACDLFDQLQELGLVVREDGRFKPTKLGWLCGNELYGRILGLAD